MQRNSYFTGTARRRAYEFKDVNDRIVFGRNQIDECAVDCMCMDSILWCVLALSFAAVKYIKVFYFPRQINRKKAK